jgi:hypothetical protein
VDRLADIEARLDSDEPQSCKQLEQDVRWLLEFVRNQLRLDGVPGAAGASTAASCATGRAEPRMPRCLKRR